MKMTKAQSVSLMNAVAILLSYISKFSKPVQFIHALSGFEPAAADIYAEMKTAGSEMGNWFGTGIENENESDQRSAEHQL